MKYLRASVMLLVVAMADAAPSLPPELVGIWATHGATFRGDALFNGEAIYLDGDGLGAFVGGDGFDVLGSRVVVASYDRASNVIAIDMTDDGKVVGHETLKLDKKDHALVFVGPNGLERYYRRSNKLSAAIRKTFGLESHPR